MLQLARGTSNFAQTLAAPDSADYGAWTGYRIPEDRSEWHPLVRSFFEYWLSVSPPGRLPGRQHIAPEEVPVLWSRMWMLERPPQPAALPLSPVWHRDGALARARGDRPLAR